MKTLQNNFTTPKQSKRLLELGVPADSADLYTSLGFENLTFIRNTRTELSEDFFDALINGKSAHIPIWSVGRLIEIIIKCEFVDVIYVRKRNFNKNTMDKLIEVVERCVKADFDFSKLED